MVLSTSAGASYRFNENKMESIQGLFFFLFGPLKGRIFLHLALSL